LRSKRLVSMLALFLAFGLIVTGCGGGGNNPASGNGGSDPKSGGAAKSGGTLNVGLDVDAGSMDPRLARDSSAYRVVELVYDGLAYLDANLKAQPALAEKWLNPDPKTWIFNLRKNVKWHDGKAFTADDVVYTYTTLLDPAMKAPNAGLYSAIAKVEVVDTHTVKFTLKDAYAPMLAYMDMGIVPKHIGEKKDNSLVENPVGTGAFKFVKWTKKSKIELEANKEYWGGAPKLDKVVLNIIPDNTNRANAIEAGDVDLIHSPVSPQDIPRLKANSKLNTTVSTGLGITYMNFNTADPVLSDVKVRQAIASLVDRKTIADKIYQKMDSPGLSVLLPTSWAFSDKITGPVYDEKKAAELLTAAGYTKDGGVWKKGGKELEITISTHTEDPNRIQAVEFIQNTLTKNGIKAKVTTAEWPTFSTAVQNSKHQISLQGWLNLVDPDRAMYNQFHSKGGTNWGKYNNAQLDKLLTDGRTETDQAKRTQIYQQAAKIVADDVVYHVVTYQGYVLSANKGVKGFEVNPKGSFRSIQKVELTK
jgi:peptide/nickel transport system substrate-binding protein